jgi:type VI protein secretion system component VasF
MSDIMDFGFTAVTADELDMYQEKKEELSSSNQQLNLTEQKLADLYNAIQPLLNNLKRDPSKDYLLWPNRVEKIEQFQQHLQSIKERGE